MKTQSIALVALASSAQLASATFGWLDAKKYTCPSNTNNVCIEPQKSGYDWSGLNLGSFTGYGGLDFKGFECASTFDGKTKRDLITGRTFQNKCIKGKATYDKATSPSFGCGSSKEVDKFSVKEFQISVEFDVDLEFHYDMPDGSTCKQKSSCKKSGTLVKNTQCGGAKNVQVILPPKYSGGGKSGCNVGFHHIGFDCAPPASTKPVYSYTKPQKSTTKAYTPPVSTTPVYTPPVYTPPAGSTSSTTAAVTTSSTTSAESTTTSAATTSSTTPAESTTTPVTTTSSTTSAESTTTPAATTSSTTEAGTTSSTTPAGTTSSTTPAGTTTTPAATTSSTTTAYTPPSGESTTVVPPPFPVNGTTSASSTTTTTAGGVTSSTTAGGVTSSTTAEGVTSSKPAETVSTTTPQPPAPTAPCPTVLPQCLNTWLFSSGCKSNTDKDCFCSSSDFVDTIYQCLAAYGASDEEVDAAQSYFQGICAVYIPSNPAIVTGVNTLTITSTAAITVPVTTVQLITTVVVPCTQTEGPSAGSLIPGSSTTTTISTALTVPQVVFQTVPGASTPAVSLVQGTAEAVITNPAAVPAATQTTLTSVRGPTGTASPTPIAFTGASSKTVASFGTFFAASLMAFLIM